MVKPESLVGRQQRLESAMLNPGQGGVQSSRVSRNIFWTPIRFRGCYLRNALAANEQLWGRVRHPQ